MSEEKELEVEKKQEETSEVEAKEVEEKSANEETEEVTERKENKKEEKAEKAEDRKADKEAVEAAYDKASREALESRNKKTTKEKKTSGEKKNVSDTDKESFLDRFTTKQKVIAIAIAAAVVIIAVAGTIIGIRTSYYNSLTRGVMVYLSDGDMMGDKLSGSVTYTSESGAWNFPGEENAPAYVTNTDGKYLYFAESTDGDDFTLYVSKVGSKKKTLISTDVSDYEILEKKTILYAIGGSLYKYRVGEETLQSVTGDSETFRVNEKKDMVLTLGNGTLASQKIDDIATRVIIDTEVSRVIEADDKFENVVYEKAGVLCVYNKGEIVELGKNFSNVNVYDMNGKYEVYFLQDGVDLFYYKKGGKKVEFVTSDVTELMGTGLAYGIFFGRMENGDLFYGSGGKANLIEEAGITDIDRNMFCQTADEEMYFIGYDSAHKGIMYSLGNSLFGKGKFTVVAQDVVSIEFADKKKVCYCKNGGDGAVELYFGEERIARGVMPGSAVLTADGNSLVYAYNQSGEGGDRLLAVYTDKMETEIGFASGDHITPVSGDSIFYLTGEGREKELMEFTGKKSKSRLTDIEDYKYIFY
ncbi:MAG: hypothetical protein IJ291_05810 [Lachnospiraceae bacterium]|nr:hypothetical protein [Lachnospiraceae bacterium]